MDGQGATTGLANATIALYSAVLAGGNLLLGSLIMLGGAARMTGASFSYVLAIAPCWAWGAAFCAAGLSTLIGQHLHWKWLVRGGHSGAGVACLFWVGAFIKGALENPSVALTGIAAYLILGALHCAAAGLTPTWVPRASR